MQQLTVSRTVFNECHFCFASNNQQLQLHRRSTHKAKGNRRYGRANWTDAKKKRIKIGGWLLFTAIDLQQLTARLCWRFNAAATIQLLTDHLVAIVKLFVNIVVFIAVVTVSLYNVVELCKIQMHLNIYIYIYMRMLSVAAIHGERVRACALPRSAIVAHIVAQ